MSTNRREFLGIAGLSFVFADLVFAPRLFAAAAEESAAAPPAKRPRPSSWSSCPAATMDSTTVIPLRERPLITKNRPHPSESPKANIHKLADGVRAASREWSRWRKLYKEGRIAIVQGVGYPEPDRSHFRSMEIWQTASTEKLAPSGRLGSVDFVEQPSAEGPDDAATPRSGISPAVCQQALPRPRRAVFPRSSGGARWQFAGAPSSQKQTSHLHFAEN